jgi:hypothetical protein
VNNKQIVQLGSPRGPPESRTMQTTRPLGSLVAAAIEKRTTDPKEVPRLATESVLHVLRRGRKQKPTLQGQNRRVVEERP